MSNILPWFPFESGSWLTDVYVRQMSLAQKGAYITLLAYEWSEGWLPADPEGLRKLLGVDRDEWDAVWGEPLVSRFKESGGRLYNSRLEKERVKGLRLHKSLSKRGKKGAESKWSRYAKQTATPEDRSKQANKREHFATAMAEVEPGQGPAVRRPGTITVTKTDTVDPKIKSGSEIETKTETETGSQPATVKPVAPRRRRPIWWDVEKGKLEGEETAKRELLDRYVKSGTMTKQEFAEHISEATFWLADRPHRRTARSDLQRFLINWLDRSTKDKRSGDVARKRVEDAQRRPSPSTAKPSSKWCADCRETLPSHAEWCPKKGGPVG